MRITASALDTPPLGNLHPVRLTFHTECLSQEELEDFLLNAADGFRRDSATLSFTVFVAEPALLIEATRWRENCINATNTECTQSGGTAWWKLEPLDKIKYPGLAEFVRLDFCSPRKSKREVVSESEVDEPQ